jgi:hypothetical protein
MNAEFCIFRRLNPELFTERKVAPSADIAVGYVYDLKMDVYDWINTTAFRIGYLKLYDNGAMIKFLDAGEATLFRMAWNVQ